MDVTMIPMVSPRTPIAEALELLRRRERSGLVVELEPAKYQLFYAGDLLRAREERVATVGEVPDARPVLHLGPHERSAGLNLVEPRQTWQAFEELLDSERVEYALAGVSEDMVMIVTRHEQGTMALTMTGGYKCSGTPTHYFPEPAVSVGARCPQSDECNGDSRIEPA